MTTIKNISYTCLIKTVLESKTTKTLQILLLIVCSNYGFGQITRTQVISNALPYTTFSWTANNCNLWNGTSCGGANIYHVPWVSAPGTYTAMPYCWGGWSTQAEYNSAMAGCKSAGQACSSSGGGCTPLPSAPLSCAAGHDCSGLVSRAWALDHKRNTGSDSYYGLLAISTQISYSQLQPGDMVNDEGSHTRLIRTYYSSNASADVIEAVGGAWKVTTNTYTPIQQTGFYAWCPNSNIVIGGCGSSCPAPANDLCSNAIQLTTSSTCNYINGTTCGATPINPTTGLPACIVSSSTAKDVWYKFTASSTGTTTLKVQSGSNFDAIVQILYNVTCASSYSQFQCTNSAAVGGVETITGFTPGTTYWVRVYNNSGLTGNDFQICVQTGGCAAPSNDNCSGNFSATPLSFGTSCNPVTGSSCGATSSGFNSCVGAQDDDVFFRFTPNTSSATINVVSASGYDAAFQVLSGPCGGSMGQLTNGCINNTGLAGTETTTVTGLTPGVEYFIRVWHYGTGYGSTGNFTICVYGQSCPPTVNITANPSGQICAGQSVTFTASSTNGGSSPGYQWKKNGVNIATGSTFSSSTLINGDVITCVMTSSLACASPPSVTSNQITMSVNTSVTPTVSITANPSGQICAGQAVTFTASSTNGGSSPDYQWKKNGVNIATGSTFSSSTLINGDVITCVMTSSLACASPPSVTSNQITMSVNTSVTPTVSITANPSGQICAGQAVTFTASSTNGGSSPGYQWKKNGVNIATGSTFSSSTFINGDVITCVMTSSLACASPPSVTSNQITMSVNTSVTPTVSITANPSGQICAGQAVTFTASSTNGGSSPGYQWKKNGVNMATGSTFSSSTLINGDVITCVMTSSLACASPPSVTSNQITMSVNTSVTPTVSITANPSGQICAGQSVTFTASSTNGGSSPGYQWKKNGVNIATGSTFSSSNLNNGDVITCVMTSSLACASPPSVTSNQITMSVNTSVTPTVSITANPSGQICAGQSVTFTASSTNGGSSPGYQWKKNGVNIATGSTFSSSNLNNGDVITCVMTSSLACASPPSVTSNQITMSVNTSVTPTVSITANPSGQICAGQSVTFTASSTNGGSSPGYQWKKNGVNIATGSIFSSNTLINGDVITCVMTSSLACASPPSVTSNQITMSVNTSVTPTVSITANPSGQICAGQSVTFTASSTNGGSSPGYQWKKNGVNIATGSTFSSSTFINGDVITCVMTSSLACASPPSVTSNQITMSVNTSVTPTVSITANPSGQICAGQSVTFTASSTNGGSSPGYQWKKNGVNMATGSTFSSSTLINGDVITCVMTSNLACASPATVSISTNPIVVNPLPSIFLDANPTVCSGESTGNITYSSTSGSPSQYSISFNQISIAAGFVNVINATLSAGSISLSIPANVPPATYGYSLTVKNSLTACVSSPVQGTITITALPGITLGSSPTVCQGETVANLTYTTVAGAPNQYSIVFDATAIAAGFRNANNLPLSNGQVAISVPQNIAAATYNASITVRNSVTGCTSISKPIKIIVNPVPVINLLPSFTIAFGERTKLGGTPLVTGNAPFSYIWTPNHNMDNDTVANPIVRPTFNTAYSVKVTDKNGCSNTKSIDVLVAGFTVYPNPATDVINIYGSRIESGIYRIKLTDASGKIIINKQIEITSTTMNEQLSINRLPHGIYFVIIENKSSQSGYRIVKIQ